MKFEAVWRSYNFWQKNADSVRNRMKFCHFLKVLQNSWNLQNLLKSPPGTCMWNLKQFGGVSIFDRKMPTALDLRKRMKFWHFLKTLQNSWNLHRIYWNQFQKHACEIGDSLEKLQILTGKYRQHQLGLQNSWNLQNLLESLPETCMWNMRWFWEVSIFCRKMPTLLDLRKRMKFWHFLKVLQNSWNLQNLLE